MPQGWDDLTTRAMPATCMKRSRRLAPGVLEGWPLDWQAERSLQALNNGGGWADLMREFRELRQVCVGLTTLTGESAEAVQDRYPRAVGTRLQDARRAAGLTQQSVADELDKARTTVVAIEKGERRVTPAELIKFARIYHRAVSEFVGLQTVTEGFVAQFRSTERQALEENSEYEAVALALQGRSEDYVELEQMAGVRSLRSYPPVYETTGSSPDQVGSEIAASERNRLGLGDGPIGNLRERLEAEVGLRVFYFAMPSKIAGVFAYNEDPLSLA